MNKQSILLYGIGSPYTCEVEESCRRLNIEIAAYVANHTGERFADQPERVIEVDSLTADLLLLPVAVPLITPGHRTCVLAELNELGLMNRPAIIDPTSPIASSAKIDEGVLINAAGSVGAHATLGAFSLMNRSSTLGHDSVMEPFSTLGPGVVVAGGVHIESGAFIGAGAVLLPGVRIGRNAIVGAGAVVVKDIPEHTVAVGNPAKILKRDIPGYNGVGV